MECRFHFVRFQIQRCTAKTTDVHRRDISYIEKITGRWWHKQTANVATYLLEEVAHAVLYGMIRTCYAHMACIAPHPNQGVPHGLHYLRRSHLQHYYDPTVGRARKLAKYHTLSGKDQNNHPDLSGKEQDDQHQYTHQKSPWVKRANRKVCARVQMDTRLRVAPTAPSWITDQNAIRTDQSFPMCRHWSDRSTIRVLWTPGKTKTLWNHYANYLAKQNYSARNIWNKSIQILWNLYCSTNQSTEDYSNSAVKHLSPSGDASIEEVELGTRSRRLRCNIELKMRSCVTFRTTACLSFACRKRKNVRSSLDSIGRSANIRNIFVENIQTRLPFNVVYSDNLLLLLVDIFPDLTSVFYQPLYESSKYLVIVLPEPERQVCDAILDDRNTHCRNLTFHQKYFRLVPLLTGLQLLKRISVPSLV